MALSLPQKFVHWWGQFATAGFITTIPDTASGNNASQQVGFPPITSQAVGAGGIPPNIADFNGILAYLSQWVQWHQAGGPIQYDASFSSNQGGYPLGTVLQSTGNPLQNWISTVANNTTNPDTGGAGWISSLNSLPLTGEPTITDGATTSNPTLAISAPISSIGVNVKLTGNGSVTPSKFIRVISGLFEILSNAGSLIFTLTDAGSMTVPGTVTGANVTATGTVTGTTVNGTTVNGTTVSATNVGASNQIVAAGLVQGATVNATGLLEGASIQSNGGTIFASGNALRASVGVSTWSGGDNTDTSRAPILADFRQTFASNNVGFTVIPSYGMGSGVYDMIFVGSVPGGGGIQTTFVASPIAFPTTCLDAIISFLGNNPPGASNPGSICVQPASSTGVNVTTNYQNSATLGVVIRARGY